ncbi:MAG: hypothetical protein Q8S84_01250 [bacterium]|nr:hypothetical protein [bacterium]
MSHNFNHSLFANSISTDTHHFFNSSHSSILLSNCLVVDENSRENSRLTLSVFKNCFKLFQFILFILKLIISNTSSLSKYLLIVSKSSF